MPVGEIATGYSALKAAYEMAKGLKDIHDRVTLNAAIIELQEKILSAQEAATSAKDQLRELQAAVNAFEDWKRIAARYDLKDYGGSTFAYELNANLDHQEPIHRACPKCFENRKRSILQFSFKDQSQRDHYKCHGCGSEFEFGVSVPYQANFRAVSWMA
jgi:DNA-directed RNA polymerase subunit M/transcription elongation factor TFIIS